MRRNHAYLACLALELSVTLAGCRQEPLPDAAMRFSVSPVNISASTKAISDDDKPTYGPGLVSDGSVVMLYGHITQGATSSAVFSGTALTCTESSGTFSWSYDPLKYWVRNAEYQFLAVFPSDMTIQGNSINGLTVDYKMQKEVSGVMQRSDCDLMVASASVASAPPVNNSVSFTFNHICAGVRFVFKDAGATSGDYHITSFELQNLYTDNTYNVSTGAWGSNENRVSSVWRWSGNRTLTNAYDYLWDTSSTVSGWQFAIPQTLDATNSKLYFTYTVGESASAQVLPVTLDLSTSSVTQWELGKVYTYKIAILAHGIDFSVSCENWTTEDVQIDPIG